MENVARRERRSAMLLDKVGEVAPRLAHDLRGRLNIISSYAELLGLETAGPLNERQKEFVENIRAGADGAQRDIQDSLDLLLNLIHAISKPGAA